MPLKKLVDGFNRFRAKYYKNGAKGGEGLMDKLAKEGAHPDFFIINCIDPRNGADLVFDTKPGELFSCSQMAAIIPPFDATRQSELIASLDYAIDAKKIKHLIVMGHSQCGGVAALVEGTSDAYIDAWVKTALLAEQAAEKVTPRGDKNALLHETERQIVIMSLKNLLDYPVVKKAVQEGRLTVNGWYFDLEKGALHEYQSAKNKFVQLSAATSPEPVVKKSPPPGPPGMAA